MDPIVIVVSESAEMEEKHFQSHQGDSFILDLAFEDEDGVAVDITGWDILFTAKVSKDLADDAADGVVKAVGDILDATAGLARVELGPADTDVMQGVYFYDVQATEDPGGDEVIRTALSGRIVFTRDVTRRTSD